MAYLNQEKQGAQPVMAHGCRHLQKWSLVNISRVEPQATRLRVRAAIWSRENLRFKENKEPLFKA
jgi:hypothetical protein